MLIDSFAVDDYYEDMVADTLPIETAAEYDNYEAYEDYEDDESERFIEHDEPKAQEDVNKVLRSMPKWKPGTQNGKPVRVKYTTPVTFRLQ